MTGQVLIREKVYDPILRILHAWNGLAILLLVLSSLVAEGHRLHARGHALWRFHVWTGYALVLGLVGRIAWGVNGPAHARWSALWHWRDWLAALRARKFLRRTASLRP
jgi:Ni/Fe-hydrogenase 1 B-type cytochrome subunit